MSSVNGAATNADCAWPQRTCGNRTRGVDMAAASDAASESSRRTHVALTDLTHVTWIAMHPSVSLRITWLLYWGCVAAEYRSTAHITPLRHQQCAAADQSDLA
jgi:hypothetical protein